MKGNRRELDTQLNYMSKEVAGKLYEVGMDSSNKIKDIYSYESDICLGKPRFDHYEMVEAGGKGFALDVAQNGKSQNVYSFELGIWIPDAENVC